MQYSPVLATVHGGESCLDHIQRVCHRHSRGTSNGARTPSERSLCWRVFHLRVVMDTRHRVNTMARDSSNNPGGVRTRDGIVAMMEE